MTNAETKKQELRAAQAFLTGRLGHKAARGTDLVEVIVSPDNTAAVYYGLTHTGQGGVYAVVRFFNAPFLELVHYSKLIAGGGRAQLPEDACRCEEPVRVEGSVLCRKCLGNLPSADEDRCKHGMFFSGAGACPQCGRGAE